MFVACFRKDRL